MSEKPKEDVSLKIASTFHEKTPAQQAATVAALAFLKRRMKREARKAKP